MSYEKNGSKSTAWFPASHITTTTKVKANEKKEMKRAKSNRKRKVKTEFKIIKKNVEGVSNPNKIDETVAKTYQLRKRNFQSYGDTLFEQNLEISFSQLIRFCYSFN